MSKARDLMNNSNTLVELLNNIEAARKNPRSSCCNRPATKQKLELQQQEWGDGPTDIAQYTKFEDGSAIRFGSILGTLFIEEDVI